MAIQIFNIFKQRENNLDLPKLLPNNIAHSEDMTIIRALVSTTVDILDFISTYNQLLKVNYAFNIHWYNIIGLKFHKSRKFSVTWTCVSR